MDKPITHKQIRSIFTETAKRNAIEIMARTWRSLRLKSVYFSILALASISPAVLAGKNNSSWVGTDFEGKECNGGRQGYGPFDYLQRASLPGELAVVEDNHFTENVENLESGNTGNLTSEIHYTLSAWPNHHRALNSILKYRLQRMPSDERFPPAECYLQRAIKFSPNDPTPYILFGLLLHKFGNYEAALSAYQTATRLLPRDIVTQYNVGLTLVELKRYEEAKKVAEEVYASGFPLPGLKNKLIRAGYWENTSKGAEPSAIPQANASATEASPASTIPSEEDTSLSKSIKQ